MTYIPNCAARSFFCCRDGCVSCLNTSSRRASSVVDTRCRAFLLADVAAALSREPFSLAGRAVVRRVLLGILNEGGIGCRVTQGSKMRLTMRKTIKFGYKYFGIRRATTNSGYGTCTRIKTNN